MNSFKNMTYYDILKVPLDADVATIQRAYREALEIYDEDSLITYSLFSDDERGDLLQGLDEAFHTLIDEDKRDAYNRALIESGRVDAGAFAAAPRKAPSTSPPAGRSQIRHRDLQTWVKRKSTEPEIERLVEHIGAKDTISGADLRQLREAFGIEISEIFEITRISGTTLRMIEDDRYADLPADIYLRAFLKSYANILQLDPGHITTGYFKSKEAATAGGRAKN